MNHLSTRSAWTLGLAALAIYLVAVRPFFGLTVDDALISFRYAQNWAAGCGPVFNCGEAPVEGYTNFLWVALSALALLLEVDVIEAMQVLGLLCGFGALLWAGRLARDCFGTSAAAIAVCIGFAASPFWALNAVVGLETAGAALSVVAAAHLSLDLPRRRPLLAGLTWGISYLVRPEAILFAVVTGAYALLRGLLLRLGARRTITGCLIYTGGFLAVAGPYFLWRAIYYRSLFPNTYYAKRGELAKIVPHNYELLAKHPLFFLALVAASLLAIAFARSRGKAIYVFIVALCSAAISLSVYNNWWMPGHRLYMTAALLLCALGGGVISIGARSLERPLRLAGPLLLLALVGALWHGAWENAEPAKKAAEHHYARAGHPAEAMGQRIRKLSRPGDWLIIRDAGFIPFFTGPRVKVLDMHDHSLNDRRIARGGWNLRYVLSRDPRFVVFASHNARVLHLAHPVEARIKASPEFAEYRQLMTAPWHAGRHYFLFVKKDR